MRTALDEYLVRFRTEDERLLQPFTPAARSERRTAGGKARAYYFMQGVLPPDLFEFALFSAHTTSGCESSQGSTLGGIGKRAGRTAPSGTI